MAVVGALSSLGQEQGRPVVGASQGGKGHGPLGCTPSTHRNDQHGGAGIQCRKERLE